MKRKFNELNDDKDYKPHKRKISFSRCPRCGAQAVKTTQRIRKNYPFGRKSRPQKNFGKKIKRCTSCGWRANESSR